jgi:MFS family permease
MALELETATMRKVAVRFLPLLGLCYTINVLDRFNVSIAALTMNKALGLSATTYGLGAGAFFWSYVLFQVPANAVLSRVGARRWITLIAVGWGLCSAGTALAVGGKLLRTLGSFRGSCPRCPFSEIDAEDRNQCTTGQGVERIPAYPALFVKATDR